VTEKSEQFTGGTVPDNGNCVEVCGDRLDSLPGAQKIGVGCLQMHDPRIPGVPGPEKSAVSELSSTTNCDSLPAQGQQICGQGSESLARRRYQEGVLELRGKMWSVRFREDMIQPDGSVGRRTIRVAVGSLKEFPNRRLARRRADEIVSRVNRL
jgi:hypothetical protein